MIDLLLIAFAKSEARFDEETEWSAEQFISYFRSNWGLYLESYLKTWEKEKEYRLIDNFNDTIINKWKVEFGFNSTLYKF